MIGLFGLLQASDAIADIGQEKPFNHALKCPPVLRLWRFFDEPTQFNQGRIQILIIHPPGNQPGIDQRGR